MNTMIKISAKGRTYYIPNAWHLLTPQAYLDIIKDLVEFSSGRLSAGMVKIRYVSRELGIKLEKVSNEDSWANLVWMAEQVTFPFLICYPDNDAALKDVDAAARAKYKRIAPEHIEKDALARYLLKLDYKYSLDGLFCAQLLPELKVGYRQMKGYSINTEFGALTCSLVAQQWLEARKLSSTLEGCSEPDRLALLAAILYCPNTYSIENAKRLASNLKRLPLHVLEAVAFNFNSFNNFLFRHTEFALLAEGKATKKAITVEADARLYDLSSYGLGSSSEVEQLNLITYLTVLRNKLIESVRSLHGANMKLTDIAAETGLPLPIITDII